jgi:4-carboxymuconolactone decarboxylase
MNKEFFERGVAMRRATLGDDYVNKALNGADDFNRPFQEFVTEYCWGAIWGRHGLPPKTRSLLNLAMLGILNRPHELRMHIRGAIRNGVTLDEMREVFMQLAVYAGVPAGVDAFRAAREVFAEDAAKA